MFVGHYGAAFAAKPASKPIPLWLLFVAVQFMDVVWSLLVFAGVEKLHIVPGFTAMNPLDLYYMPYTHGLIGSLVLSALLGGVSEYALPQKGRTFLIIAACVFSHWLLDLVVHVPDLPLIGDRMKVGFGLWRWRDISLAAEFVTLFGGLWVMMRYAPSPDRSSNIGSGHWRGGYRRGSSSRTFGLQPATPQIAAAMALGGYTVFALFAWQVDRARAASGADKVPALQLNI